MTDNKAPSIKPIKLKQYECKQSNYEVAPELPMRSMILSPSGGGKTVEHAFSTDGPFSGTPMDLTILYAGHGPAVGRVVAGIVRVGLGRIGVWRRGVGVLRWCVVVAVVGGAFFDVVIVVVQMRHHSFVL